MRQSMVGISWYRQARRRWPSLGTGGGGFCRPYACRFGGDSTPPLSYSSIVIVFLPVPVVMARFCDGSVFGDGVELRRMTLVVGGIQPKDTINTTVAFFVQFHRGCGSGPLWFDFGLVHIRGGDCFLVHNGVSSVNLKLDLHCACALLFFEQPCPLLTYPGEHLGTAIGIFSLYSYVCYSCRSCVNALH